MKQRGLVPFKPGQSGNPKGRPKGSLNNLGEQFIADLYADWQEHGAAALVKMQSADPAAYVRMVASILPKELPIKNENPLENLSEDELREALEAIRALCAAGARKA